MDAEILAIFNSLIDAICRVEAYEGRLDGREKILDNLRKAKEQIQESRKNAKAK